MTDLWAVFESAALQPGVSDLERDQVRRVFYAGALSMCSLLETVLDDGAPGAEARGAAVLERARRELLDFAARDRPPSH